MIKVIEHDPKQIKVIDLTESAKKHFAKQIESTQDAIGIRFALKTAGCAGYMTDIKVVTEQHADDQTFEFEEGIKVFMNKENIKLLHGTVIDYVSKGVNKVVQLNNPRFANACGCGESIEILEDENDDE